MDKKGDKPVEKDKAGIIQMVKPALPAVFLYCKLIKRAFSEKIVYFKYRNLLKIYQEEANMKKLIYIGLVSMLLVSCSSPKHIVLTDGSVIRTKDEPEYKRKLDVYEYEDEQGNKGIVNAKSVKIIQPIDVEIPEPKVVEPQPAEKTEAVPETSPEVMTESEEVPAE